MVRRYGATDFITGLRAYAAVAVVMVHTAAFSGFGDIGRNISVAGMHGVVMFFVIAGFSVATSYHQIGAYRPYLVRRLIRIWPIYMLVIGATFLASQTGPLHAFDVYNVLMHATFLSFLDYRIANSILGVEWTIPVEVFWYMVLPLVMRRPGQWRHLLGIAVGFLLLNAVLRGLASLLAAKHLYPVQWMPFTHAPFFLAGVLAYQLRTVPTLWPAIDRDQAARVVPLAAVGAIVVVAACPLGTGIKSTLIGLATFALIACHRPAQGGVGWLLENRMTLVVGAISYSLYLVHVPVLRIIQAVWPGLSGLPLFATVLAAATAVSLVTFYLVEQPTNNLGRRLTARGQAQRRPSAV